MRQTLSLTVLSPIVFAFVTATAQTPQPADATDDALLRSVIRQNTAAIESIKSLYAEISWTEESVEEEIPISPDEIIPGGRRTVVGSSKVWEQDGLYHEDMQRTTTWHNAGKTKTERFISVLNDKYFAWLIEDVEILTVYRFENRESMYEPAVRHSSRRPNPSIRDYGLGLIWTTLEEHYKNTTEQHSGNYSWSILQEDVMDEHRFVIKNMRDIKVQPYLFQEIVVDPERGFLIPEYRAYRADGKLKTLLQCTLAMTPQRQWFPMHVKCYRDQRESNMEITVKDVQVNVPINASIFTLESMAFDPKVVTMTEYSPGGRDKAVKTYRNGQWLPIELLRK